MKETAGVCCGCGYDQPDETPCPSLKDGHCVHWWDGPKPLVVSVPDVVERIANDPKAIGRNAARLAKKVQRARR